MKKFLFFLLIIFSISTYGQNSKIKKDQSGVYSYKEVFKVDSIDANQIFNKAKEWIALNYNSANDVIQLEDKDNHKLICKGNFKINYMFMPRLINHTLIIEAKTNKYRITYTQFSIQNDSKSSKTSFDGVMISRKKIFKRTEKKIKTFLSDLYKTIKEQSNSDDDW